jgi:hypothetical protein
LSEVALLFIRFNIMESVDVNIKGARWAIKMITIYVKHMSETKIEIKDATLRALFYAFPKRSQDDDFIYFRLRFFSSSIRQSPMETSLVDSKVWEKLFKILQII